MTLLSLSHLPKGRTLAAVAILAASSLFAQMAQAQAPTTQTFMYTGLSQTWTVPANVTSVTITAEGAQGYNEGGLGGLGGRAIGTLAVTPGQTLQINVGGAGEAPAGVGQGGGGGFNGGGPGRSSSNGQAGGGGGASDVRQGGTNLADRKIVAGGGGGGGPTFMLYGGGGGGLQGGAGSAAITGGTQNSGGAGEFQGSLGQGGNALSTVAFASGGGGGYFGGGASTYNAGGGGSAYIGGVTNATTTTGFRTGSGLVTLTYTAAAPPAPVPTLSEWAMIGLGLTLAGGAALYIQRRRTLA